MDPQNQQQPPPSDQPSPMPYGPVNNPLSVMQENEQVICEIKRHPIGMIGIYVTSGFILLVIAVLAFAVAPDVLTSQNRSQVLGIGSLVFLVVAALMLVFVFISSKIYKDNRWIVTSDSVTQISRTGLFDKQSSQLSLGNLEDVTSVQDGPLAHMFNFGVLRLETAGERSKFNFPFCPDPNNYAQKVLRAREDFEQGRRGSENMQRPYREQGAYSQPPSPIPPASPQQ